MLKTIIYREFLSNIITFRFLFGLLICVGLVGSSTYVLMRNYEDRLQAYQLAIQAHTDEIRNIRVYSDLALSHRPKADKKPKLMSILNQGIEGRLGNSVAVSHSYVPVFTEQHGSDNPYLVVFSKIDLALVFQIVISLLAFLFAYDAIAGDRENGTLALTLSNSVPRNVVILGKYLGGMLSLVVPLALSLLVSLQIIFFLSPYAVISKSDWARIGLFFIVSLIYVSVSFILGMLFSSATRRSATALMLAMFFWVVFVLIWPNAGSFAVSKLAPLKSDAHLTDEGAMVTRAKGEKHLLIELWYTQFDRELNKFAKQHNIPMMPVRVSAWFDGGQSNWEGDTYIGRYNGPPEKLPLFHEFFKFREELVIQYADKIGKMRHEYLIQNPIRQAKLVQKVAQISPAAAYADATSILVGTDLESHIRFLDQANQYRNELIQYLREQNAFASAAWYNQEAFKKVDAEGIPLFRERQETLSSSLRQATVDILILVLLNVAFFLLTYLSLLKCDVR